MKFVNRLPWLPENDDATTTAVLRLYMKILKKFSVASTNKERHNDTAESMATSFQDSTTDCI